MVRTDAWDNEEHASVIVVAVQQAEERNAVWVLWE